MVHYPDPTTHVFTHLRDFLFGFSVYLDVTFLAKNRKVCWGAWRKNTQGERSEER